MKFCVLYFCFCSYTLGIWSEKSSLYQCNGLTPLHFLAATSLSLDLKLGLSWVNFSIWWQIRIQFHSFAYVHPVFPALFVEEVIFTPLYDLSTVVNVWLDVWGLTSGLSPVAVPVHLCIDFLAAPHCFNYCSFVVCFEVRYYDASCLTFLFRLALAILGSFVILFYYIILTILEQGILFDFFNVPDDFFHQCLIIFIMEIIFCVYG